MHRQRTSILPALSLALVVASAPSLLRADEPAPDDALARTIEHGAESGWSELWIRLECRQDSEMKTVEMFGNGVAIWGEAAQYEVPRSLLEAVLRDLQRADFARMQSTYGGKNDLPKPSDRQMAMQVVCRLELKIDGHDKEVVQLHEGERSERFLQLADGILKRQRPYLSSATTIDGLSEGFEAIAAGHLAIETMEASLLLVPDRGARRFVRLDDASLLTGRGTEIEREHHEIESSRIASLAATLAELELEALPYNLFAPDYVDLRLRVLDQAIAVQGRRFAGMSADTDPESQRRFAAAISALTAFSDSLRDEREATPAPSPE